MAWLDQKLVNSTMVNLDLYDRRQDAAGRSLLDLPRLQPRRCCGGKPEAKSKYVARLRKKVAYKHASKNYDWAEFGVANGSAAKTWLQFLPEGKHIYLFDAWEGEGLLSTEVKIPKFILKHPGAVTIKGLFQTTLADWVKTHPEPLGLISIGSVLYQPADFVLNTVEPLITRDTVVMFDALAGRPEYLAHEYKAFVEFIDRTGWDFHWLTTSIQFDRIAVRFYPD